MVFSIPTIYMSTNYFIRRYLELKELKVAERVLSDRDTFYFIVKLNSLTNLFVMCFHFI